MHEHTEWHPRFPNAAVPYKKKGNVASRLCVEENTEDQEEGKYKESAVWAKGKTY
jgi:hypothetical protein